jgi:hypothetical protein
MPFRSQSIYSHHIQKSNVLAVAGKDKKQHLRLLAKDKWKFCKLQITRLNKIMMQNKKLN